VSVQCPPDRRASTNAAGVVLFHRLRPTGRTWCGKWERARLDPPGLTYEDARSCGNCDRIFDMRGGQAAPPG
jgi:hypothetical protein